MSGKNIPSNIESPLVIYILKTIKAMQTRMKEPDLINRQYAFVYDTLSKEFNNFFEKEPAIFTRVIRGESMATIASILYYKDKESRGLINQDQISDQLATRFIPEHLKKEADERIKEMKASKTE